MYPVAPAEGADPNEIVDGFLEAMTSDDPDFAVARKYLTKQASQSWRPANRTTVLASAPDPADPQGPSGPDGPGLTYPLFGDQIAAVDAGHAYQPVEPEPYNGSIHLVQENVLDGKEWRIDDLPQGLVLGESDFQRNYRAVNKYYFAPGQGWLVADPVYIRQRIDPVTRMDPVTQAVKVLLEGPTDWMRPVVDSPFPTGTELKRGTRTLEFDDRNALKVPLNSKVDNVGREQCRKMAAQLLFTLRDLTSTRGEQVELLRQDGSSLCVLSGDQAEEFAADRTSGSPDSPYFIDAKGRLAQLSASSKEPIDPPRVRGPFGDGTMPLGQVAVARDEKHAAGVSQDAKSMYVGSIISAGEVGDALVVSKAEKKEDRLSAPSWDGNGDLWIADRDPQQPRLLRLADGADAPREVTVDGLGDARIEALRVSADGVRVALLLTEDGRTTLQIGRVERRGPAGRADRVRDGAEGGGASYGDRDRRVVGRSQRLVVVGKEAAGCSR